MCSPALQACSDCYSHQAVCSSFEKFRQESAHKAWGGIRIHVDSKAKIRFSRLHLFSIAIILVVLNDLIRHLFQCAYIITLCCSLAHIAIKVYNSKYFYSLFPEMVPKFPGFRFQRTQYSVSVYQVGINAVGPSIIRQKLVGLKPKSGIIMG